MARGSITKRGDSYRVRVSYESNGKRRQICGTAESIGKAEKLRTKLLSQVDNGSVAEPRGTLGDYLNRWLGEYVQSNLSPTTFTGYEYVIKTHIIPVIGSIQLKNLKPETLQKYYADKLQSGLSATSVRHHHSLLHRALKQATQWNLLMRNPADSVSAPRCRKTDMHILSQSQIDSVLQASGANHPIFALALHSGMRRSELLALRWSDIDLTMAEISVCRSLIPLPGGKHTYKETKTAKGRRTVALSPNTCQVLRQHLDAEMALCGRMGIKFSNDRLVFCQYTGEPLKGNSVWKAWHTLVARLGISGVRFHDCRHTMASAMLRAGVHPKIVQERLGHSSIAITLDIYSHVAPGLQHAAANKLDELFANQNPQSGDHSVTIGKMGE